MNTHENLFLVVDTNIKNGECLTNYFIISTTLNSWFLLILTIGNSFKCFTNMVDRKCVFNRFSVKNVYSDISEVTGNVANNYKRT